MNIIEKAKRVPKAVFGIIAVLAGTLIIYTNAGNYTGFDVNSLSCQQRDINTIWIGNKFKSEKIEDCSRNENLYVRSVKGFENMRGIDSFQMDIQISDPVNWQSLASHFFDTKVRDTEFRNVYSKKTSFYSPNFKNVKFLSGNLDEFKLIGANISLLDNVEMQGVNFYRSEFANISFNETRFHDVNFEGRLQNIQTNSFKAKNMLLKNVELANVDFSNAQFIEANFSGSKICGPLNFSKTYFSKSTIELSTLGLKCLELSKIDFSDANLRYNTIRIQDAAAMEIDFSGADLSGANLSQLNFSKGKWNFKGAIVNKDTVLPAKFPFANQLKRQTAEAKQDKAKKIARF